LSDTARLSVVLPAMLGVHALVGIGEAVITAMVLSAVLRFRPELLEIPGNAGVSASRGRSLIGYGLGLSVAIAAVLAPIACDSPDGLSSVAQSLGFQGAERVGLVAAPLAEYGVPGLATGLLATVVAGSVGTLLLFGLCWLLALGLVPRSRRSRQTSSARVAVESSG